MAIYNGPPRGGTRGGRDQFSWDTVKSDKDREFYLGHSLKAPVGRWQKGKDILWYTREKSGSGSTITDEQQAVKQREQELMLQALGIKPKDPVRQPSRQLEKHELAELLRQDTDETNDSHRGADRVKGLGYGHGPSLATAEHEVMVGVGIRDADRGADEGVVREAGAKPTGTLGSKVQLSEREVELLEKAIIKTHKKDKQSKKEKKKKKKAAKDAKKAKGDKKMAKQAVSTSSSDSDSLRNRQGARHDSRDLSPGRHGKQPSRDHMRERPHATKEEPRHTKPEKRDHGSKKRLRHDSPDVQPDHHERRAADGTRERSHNVGHESGSNKRSYRDSRA